MALCLNSKYGGFDYFPWNLKYVVLDEMHTYRGAFGSHWQMFSGGFRGLQSITRSLIFYGSSATIANPVELAENLWTTICFGDKRRFGGIRAELSADTATENKRKDQQCAGRNPLCRWRHRCFTVDGTEEVFLFAKSRKMEVVLKRQRPA